MKKEIKCFECEGKGYHLAEGLIECATCKGTGKLWIHDIVLKLHLKIKERTKKEAILEAEGWGKVIEDEMALRQSVTHGATLEGYKVEIRE